MFFSAGSSLAGAAKAASEPALPRASAALLVTLAGLSLALSQTLGGCAFDPGRIVVAPPRIAGADFVGTETCAQCHDLIARDFPTATHALLVAKGDNNVGSGCESCHGPGSLHAESGGGANTIVNPRGNPDVCFQCHTDKRGEFMLPYTHPVARGPLELTDARMSCVDCHQPHKGDAVAQGRTNLANINTGCFQCHPAQRGPFVFEHEALREGCTICHSPHGSVNQKMLTERDGTLCLKCHTQQQLENTTFLIGGQDHSTFLTRGTCWSAGCHEAVHGSNVSILLRF